MDLRLNGRGFDFRLLRFQVATLGKLFTHTRASVTKQNSIFGIGQGAVMPCGWEGTGHASQTTVVYPITGSQPTK